MDRDTALHWLVLSRLPGCSPAVRRKLHKLNPDPRVLLGLDDKTWRQAGAGVELLRARNSWSHTPSLHRAQIAAESDLEVLERANGFLIALGTAGYPALLAEIHDPPPLLYCAGKLEALSPPQVAIVGSRRCGNTGRSLAAEFAQALVGHGVSVCSGLALGIDAAAHRGALAGGGPTLAVMATGIDRCYPARHRELADEVRDRGLLLTEFPPGTAPRPERFPMRNRLISGLSAGVLVVEAGLRSGSLITARLALEQNREVFAVPHSIRYPGGEGCLELLRQGAWLASSVKDILEQIGLLCSVHSGAVRSSAVQTNQVPPTLPPQLATVFSALGFEPVGVDELVLADAGDAPAVLSALLELQILGLVENRGGLYMRK